MADETPRLRLHAFEGPLDLLLHLIATQELDIYQIPIAHITDQYLNYLRDSLAENMDVASEFIVMAATLIALKARSLLPRTPTFEPLDEFTVDRDSADDESELTRRLLGYRAFKEAAVTLAHLEAARSETVSRLPMPLTPFQRELTIADRLGHVSLTDLRTALCEAVARKRPAVEVEVVRDRETIPQRMRMIERALMRSPTTFASLLQGHSRQEIVTVFLALLELIRQHKVTCRQERRFSDIWISLWNE